MSTATAIATAAAAAAPDAAAQEEMGGWEEFPSMNTPRSCFGLAADGDRLLYAVGGHGRAARTTAEVWDATTNKWTALPEMTVGREFCTAAVMDGRLFAIGGFSGGNDEGTTHDSVSAYDPNTRLWAEDIPPMHAGRWGCAAVAFEGELFVFGGRDGDDILASAEVFNLSRGSWTVLPDMSRPRCRCAAAVVGGQIFVVGGYDGSDYLDSIEVFDPRSKEWSSAILPSMSCGRASCAAAGWDDRLYVFGGFNPPCGRLRLAEVFDVGEGAWSRLPDMAGMRVGCMAVQNDGRVIVVGGWGVSCEAFFTPYRHRIDREIAANLPRRQKDCLLQVMIVARRLDDERARQGEVDVGPDLWWRILSMLRVGDLKQDGSSGRSEDQKRRRRRRWWRKHRKGQR